MQIFNLSLACILSLGASDPERTFCVVFIVVIAGALLLTINVVLLGGAVSLLQSVSLLGYCMFPLDLAAVFCYFVRPLPQMVAPLSTWWHPVVAAIPMSTSMNVRLACRIHELRPLGSPGGPRPTHGTTTPLPE